MAKFTKSTNRITLGEGQKLSDYEGWTLNFSTGLPDGIFNKKYPGTGATYCEFMSDRPSIIVFPFKKLALEKAEAYKKKGRNTLYVGTDKNGKSLKEADIKIWYRKNKDSNPKFSVVADSIGNLVKALQEEKIDPFKEFKLVLDEVELLQMQSGFRGRLPLCFDYFKRFKNKCLVSATLLDFSDNQLKKLKVFDLEIASNFADFEGIHHPIPKKRIQIRRFSKEEPHVGVANQIVNYYQNNPEKSGKIKFFIGLNSIDGIKEMLSIFEKAGITSISVLVSEGSSDKISPGYKTNDIKDGILPSDITITTCINWSGIDIYETFHSVAISLNTKIHHSFSVENLIQFFGRSRKDDSRNTFTLAIGPSPEIEYRERTVPMHERKAQIEKLIGDVKKDIQDKKDKAEMLKALTKTESSLIYEDMNGNPAVNWLLEDLEKYQRQVVEDYKDEAARLLKRLSERFEVQEIPFDEEFEIQPDIKTDLEKIEEDYETFLENLNSNYLEAKLASKFLDKKERKNKRVAAFWYYFGRTLGLKDQESYDLAKYFSGLYKPWNQTEIVITALRVFFRHNPAFQDLIRLIEKAKSTQQNVTSKDVLDAIKSDVNLKEHFKGVIYGSGSDQNMPILFTQFFGMKKQSDGKLYSLKGIDLSNPKLIKDRLHAVTDKLDEAAKTPSSNGVKSLANEISNFIDEKFQEKK